MLTTVTANRMHDTNDNDAAEQDSVLERLEHEAREAILRKDMPLYLVVYTPNNTANQNKKKAREAFAAHLLQPKERKEHRALIQLLFRATLLNEDSSGIRGMGVNGARVKAFIPFAANTIRDNSDDTESGIMIAYFWMRVAPLPPVVRFDSEGRVGVLESAPQTPVASLRLARVVAVIDPRVRSTNNNKEIKNAPTESIGRLICAAGAARPRSLSVCWGCEQPSPARMRKCGRCCIAHYCSKACQVQHWLATHRDDECAQMRLI